MEVLLEPVEVPQWGQSHDGEFVIIASMCGDPVTDELMREAEQRVRQALKGIPATLGISEPPSITIRPMWRGGISRGLRSEAEHGEAIAITPWNISGGKAHPVTPSQIVHVVVHEVAHWLLNHAGYNGASHGPVFTSTLIALYQRLDSPGWHIQKLSLYDIGFDENADTLHPTWWDSTGPSTVNWSIWLPRALRDGQRYAKTGWPASRIASALVARNERWNWDGNRRLKVIDIVNEQSNYQQKIDSYAIKVRKLSESLKAARAEARSMKSDLSFLRKYSAALTFICMLMLAILVSHS